MILIVDDEKRYMDNYMIELAVRYKDLNLETSVNAALNYFQANLAGIKLLILDIMMPPGDFFNDPTAERGLRTGVSFFETVRKVSADLSVIIFTNVGDPQLEARFEREKNCWFLRKTDYLPHEFAEEVERIMSLR